MEVFHRKDYPFLLDISQNCQRRRFFLLKQESYPDEKVFLRNFRLNLYPLVGSYGQQVFFLFLSCNSFCNTDVVVDTGTVEYLLLGIQPTPLLNQHNDGERK